MAGIMEGKVVIITGAASGMAVPRHRFMPVKVRA